jgi:hypothetical protein
MMKKVSNFILDLIDNGQITWDPGQFEDRNFLDVYFGETPGKPQEAFKDTEDMENWATSWMEAHYFQVIKIEKYGDVVFMMDQKYWTYKDMGSHEVMVDLFAHEFLPDAHEVKPKKVVKEVIEYEPVRNTPDSLVIRYIRKDGAVISEAGVGAYKRVGWLGVGVSYKGTSFIVGREAPYHALKNSLQENKVYPGSLLEHIKESGVEATKKLSPDIKLGEGEYLPSLHELLVIEENLGVIQDALGRIGLPKITLGYPVWTSTSFSGTDLYTVRLVEEGSRIDHHTSWITDPSMIALILTKWSWKG